MKLSKCQTNLLSAIAHATCKQSGPNAGDCKGTLDSDSFYWNTLCALARRGLVEHVNNVHGCGVRATRLGFDTSRKAAK